MVEYSPKVKAAQESAEAHREATGHEHIDMVQVGHFPVVLLITCTECGQHIATVRK